MKELTDLQFDIILILSDNQGYPLRKLAELLKKEKTNLIITLQKLENDPIEGTTNSFKFWDVNDSMNLGKRLEESKDPLSCYIRDRLGPNHESILRICALYSPICVKMLNELLIDPDLFRDDRFEHIELGEKMQKIVHNNLIGKDQQINRLLFEIAYPEDLQKSDTPIIYKGQMRKTTNLKSCHPNQLEIPYYIKPNLHVFNFILKNFYSSLEYCLDSRDWALIEERKLELMDLTESLLLEKKFRDKYHDRLKLISAFDNTKKFLFSKYTTHLFELFDTPKVMDIILSNGLLFLYTLSESQDNKSAYDENQTARGHSTLKDDVCFGPRLS
jgi:hypothetical protein